MTLVFRDGKDPLWITEPILHNIRDVIMPVPDGLAKLPDIFKVAPEGRPANHLLSRNACFMDCAEESGFYTGNNLSNTSGQYFCTISEESPFSLQISA